MRISKSISSHKNRDLVPLCIVKLPSLTNLARAFSLVWISPERIYLPKIKIFNFWKFKFPKHDFAET
jgi:hypothetical protein